MHAGSQPVPAHAQAVTNSFVTTMARGLNETIDPVTQMTHWESFS